MTLRIQCLSNLTSDCAGQYGGKAWGLSRLLAAGARVPEGFALEASSRPPDRWTEGERERFSDAASKLLSKGPITTRSSALGEDASRRSFAGMLETVLGIITPDEALAGAARCIASGSSDRVLAYSGSGCDPLAVGVVVQRQVEARSAGVCFTSDPAGKDGAAVIEAVHGAGAELLSGAQAPERWRVYRSGLGGLECRPEAEPEVLALEDVCAIAEQALMLAGSLGEPLDLEWALDREGTLWWLQARPITAAAAPIRFVVQRSFGAVQDGPVTVWSNWNVRETMPEPLFPLTWAAWQNVILPLATHQLFGIPLGSALMPHMLGLDLVHGRIYFNMNACLAVPFLGRTLNRLLSLMDPETAGHIRDLREQGVLRPRRLPGSRLQRHARAFLAGLRSLFRLARFGLTPRRSLGSLERDGVAVSRRPNVRSLSNRELLEELGLWLSPQCGCLAAGLQMEAAAVIVYGLAGRVFKGHDRARHLLATGITANPTTQISIAIDTLVTAARPHAPIFLETDSPLEILGKLEQKPGADEWIALFQDFLSRFGHRGPMEFDLGAPCWSEDPSMIVELVRAGLRGHSREDVLARMTRLGRERSRQIDIAVGASRPWRRPLMRALARLVELYMPLREAPKHYGVFVFQRMREAALELGGRLAESGILETREDVFFMEWRELAESAEGRPACNDLCGLLAKRKEMLARFKRERPPDILRSDGVPVAGDAARSAAEEGVLQGTAVSAGAATGSVRILNEPDPRLVREGDIIVMHFADPGWTPIFPQALAIIVEIGGLMCHAAVVAREMGIPAVFGIRDATRILKDAQRVRVDGSLGTVTILGLQETASRPST